MDIYTCKDPAVEESVERGHRQDAEQSQRCGRLGELRDVGGNVEHCREEKVDQTHTEHLHTENEQALVCLSNREILDVSRGRPFHCKMANNHEEPYFSRIVWAYLFSHSAIPPSIIMAFRFPPSTLAVDFFLP